MRIQLRGASSLAVLVLCLSSACGETDLEESVGSLAQPLGPPSIARVDGALSIDAPPGEWNGFQVYAHWDDWNQEVDGPVGNGECSASTPVYDVYRQSEETFLPGAVRLGEPIPMFESTACVLGGDAEIDCELTANVTGLTWDAFTYPHYACEHESGRYPVDGFQMVYYRVHPGAEAYWALSEEEQLEAEMPVIDTATASFRVEADGVTLTPTSDWLRCDDALNSPCN